MEQKSETVQGSHKRRQPAENPATLKSKLSTFVGKWVRWESESLKLPTTLLITISPTFTFSLSTLKRNENLQARLRYQSELSKFGD